MSGFVNALRLQRLTGPVFQTTLDCCIEQQVGGVAKATSAGFTSLIAQREGGVAELREEVQRLEAEVKDTTDRLAVDRK